jgi:3-oxoacyl-[acyl-carrier-protein] synthase III
MLEELVSSGRLQHGQRILGMIPESGRFSVGYVLLTVV